MLMLLCWKPQTPGFASIAKCWGCKGILASMGPNSKAGAHPNNGLGCAQPDKVGVGGVEANLGDDEPVGLGRHLDGLWEFGGKLHSL